jgi:hypothetical protein
VAHVVEDRKPKSLVLSLGGNSIKRIFILLCLVFLPVVAIVIGVVCGTGLCSPDDTPVLSKQVPRPPPTKEPQYRSFTTTDELYQAVDVYILNLTGDPNTSIVSGLYGHPIGSWNVSQIKNFSRVFDPDRTSIFDLARPPSFISNFNEDLSGWNVSSAETMFGMFAFAQRCTYCPMNGQVFFT